MTAQPRTSFDWSIYREATLAGLSTLIPIPLLDDAFERFFQRRMLESIARSRGVELPEQVRAALFQSERGCVAGCLRLPLRSLSSLLRRLPQKLLYVLTIKRATDQLSAYWQRAFLLDYMLAAGHLATPASARQAYAAMEAALEAHGGPLNQLARQVIGRTRHVWRSLRGARRGRDDAVLDTTRAELDQQWGRYASYFQGLAQRYEQLYQQPGQR